MLTIKAMSLDAQEVCEEIILYPSATFDAYYESSWLNNILSKRILTDIQGIDFINSSNKVEDLLLQNGMRPEDLATGTKNLLNCLFLKDERFCRLGMMGENCYKWLVEISKQKDIIAITTHAILFTDNDIKGEHIKFLDTNKFACNAEEFLQCMSDLIRLDLFR